MVVFMPICSCVSTWFCWQARLASMAGNDPSTPFTEAATQHMQCRAGRQAHRSWRQASRFPLLKLPRNTCNAGQAGWHNRSGGWPGHATTEAATGSKQTYAHDGATAPTSHCTHAVLINTRRSFSDVVVWLCCFAAHVVSSLFRFMKLTVDSWCLNQPNLLQLQLANE